MEEMEEVAEGLQIQRDESRTANELLIMDPTKMPSPVIARLIEEVRNEAPQTTQGYNRFHNRHNR